MKNKVYRPRFDKLFYLIWAPLIILLLVITILSWNELIPLIIMLFTDVFCLYFLFSSLVAYVEFRDDSLFVKCGFILKKEIPYSEIKEINKERKLYTYSMLSIKNAMEHVNIKYNKYDWISVSVIDNDAFIVDLNKRINKSGINFGIEL